MAKKILVIDDEPDVLQVLSMFLGNAGFETETAIDAKTAGEKIQNTPVDLILLDIMLPDKSGFQFCEELKKTSFASIPIVMVSAKTDAADIVKGLRSGADDYITKPIDFEKFVDRIN
ncbi:MAG: response regulator, partial [Candidatus Margulisiibacteriota bacterium]